MSEIRAIRSTHTFITANTSNAANATTTGTALDRGANPGGPGPVRVVVRLENMATLTAPARVRWAPSFDGTNYDEWIEAGGGSSLANGAITVIEFEIPEPYRHVNISVTGNAGGAVMIRRAVGAFVTGYDIV